MPDRSCVVSCACVLSSAAKGLGVNLVVLVMLRTPGKKLSTSSVCRCSREQRRALKMLADAPTGVSEEVLVVAYGFSAEMLSGLVLAALARVVSETRTVRRGFDQGRALPHHGRRQACARRVGRSLIRPGQGARDEGAGPWSQCHRQSARHWPGERIPGP